MEYLIIAILSAAVLFLAARLFLIKKQLCKVSKQLDNYGDTLISVELTGDELEEIVLKINTMIDDISRIKTDADKNSAALKENIADISHDIRTPLTSIIGYLQLAEKSCKDEETLQNIRVALDRARYSNKLVDDFFELSLADSEHYNPKMENVNLCEVVCEEILTNYPVFEKKGITPLFEQANDDIQVYADRKLLVRVIQNLISNGIKYSTGEIKFVIIEGQSVTLAVSNSISKDVDTEKIFDKFYRADVSRKGEGTGLGLYICRKFVAEMNGKISARSENKRLTINIEFLK